MAEEKPLGKLTPLQARVLRVLAGLSPPWTLSGGGALVGFYLRHRTTKDLDLFWHGQDLLGQTANEAEQRLATGLDVSVLQNDPAFCRLRVSDGAEVLVVDLVADPVPTVESPRLERIGDTTISIDTPHEILVNKLCALLSRSELRDLVDVKALLEAGGDLERGLRDVPIKERGFSPLTLAWVLQQLPVPKLAQRLNWDSLETDAVERFRKELAERIARAAKPE